MMIIGRKSPTEITVETADQDIIDALIFWPRIAPTLVAHDKVKGARINCFGRAEDITALIEGLEEQFGPRLQMQ
jgi:hypothetical protein